MALFAASHHGIGYQVSGIRYQVSGIRYQVSGIRCQVSGVRYQVSGIRCQVSGVRCRLWHCWGLHLCGSITSMCTVNRFTFYFFTFPRPLAQEGIRCTRSS
ncbi:hypothetical protein D7I39_11355 [Allopusillimonas ginsengisoli]|nr:hypothetical protein D7I39_11355 [Allopusillimonas ginsengisoli]